MKSRRKFTKEFKQTAVRRLESGQSVAEVARALEVHPSDLHRWRRELHEHGARAFSCDFFLGPAFGTSAMRGRGKRWRGQRRNAERWRSMSTR